VRNRGPWKNLDELEFAVAEYIDWSTTDGFTARSEVVPPVEYEVVHRSATLPEQPAPREFHVSIKPGT
jgi:putative transposase